MFTVFFFPSCSVPKIGRVYNSTRCLTNGKGPNFAILQYANLIVTGYTFNAHGRGKFRTLLHNVCNVVSIYREYVYSVAVYQKYLTRLGELIIFEPWRENYHFS